MVPVSPWSRLTPRIQAARRAKALGERWHSERDEGAGLSFDEMVAVTRFPPGMARRCAQTGLSGVVALGPGAAYDGPEGRRRREEAVARAEL